MPEANHHSPGFSTLVRKVATTSLGALQNRAELAALEWVEEKARLTQIMMWTVGLVFLGVTGTLLVTGIVIVLCPEHLRIWVASGFAFLYLAGAVTASVVLKSLLQQEAFTESIGQVKKDRVWFESFK